jgi:DNA-binding response OmpR family regulator
MAVEEQRSNNLRVCRVSPDYRRLRKAINPPGTNDMIRTVRSAGYSLDPA